MSKLNKKAKKGFTLVELVVVIAIIAILGAVSVVGYFAFIEKANKSADEQLCTQYNTILKAASVEDDDITLPELVVLMEENGINSNQFKTVSKDYVFAYNRPAAEVVLLDKDTGNPAFPTQNEAKPEGLWSTLDSNVRYHKGVYNYCIFNSFTYKDGRDSNTGITYNIDLNNRSLTFGNSNPKETLRLSNGTIIAAESLDKVITGDNATRIDPSVQTKAETGAKIAEEIKYTNDTERKADVIDGKYITTTSPKKVTVELPTAVTPGNKVVYENCTFDNVELATNHVTDLEIINCTFVNKEGYVVQLSKDVERFVFKNNKVIESNRGINITVPTKELVIENNEFSLSAIETANKSERKDNAIQIAFSDKLFEAQSWKDSSEIKLATASEGFHASIKNNKVHKAQALLTLHAGFGQNATTQDRCDAVKNLLLTEAHWEITGNELLDTKTVKLTRDPGTEEDCTKTINDLKNEPKPTLTELLDRYEEMFGRLLSLIK